MRRKLTLGALATAAVFVTFPAVAQTSGQKSRSQPGMCMAMGSQSGHQHSSGMCGCCQGMGRMQQPRNRPSTRRH